MVDISNLTLLRNDPAVVEVFLKEAHEGDLDAQYGLGLIYAEGRGVPQDDARAFYWLTRAIDQGDRDAEILRNNIAVGMSSDELDRADLMIKEHRGLLTSSLATTAQSKRHKVRH